MNKKQWISLLLTAIMCFSIFSSVFAAPTGEESYTVVNAAPGQEGISVDGGFLNAGAGGYIDGNVNGDEWYMGDAGNSVSFKFTGTAVRVISGKNADLGIANIYIDGVIAGTADLYNSSWIKQQTVFEKTGLSDGEHTVKVECSGNKNDASSGKIVIVDAFSYVKSKSLGGEWVTLDNTDSKITYTGNFNGDFGGTYNGNVTFYETAEIVFKGTGVEIISSKNNDMGISEVYIDGVLKGEIDYYDPSFIHQQSLFKTEELENKEHTLRIVKTSRRNENVSAGAGGLVSIDAIKYFAVKEEQPDPDEGKFITVNAAAGINGITTNGGFLNKGADGYIQGNIEGDEWYMGAGNSISFAFSGTRVKIIAGTNNDMGIANIYIDGNKVAEVDCYSSAWIKGGTIFDSGTLLDGEHTVKMECSGNKNASSANNIIVCDAFMYVPTYIAANEMITVDDASNKVAYKGGAVRLADEGAIEGTLSEFSGTATFSFDGSYLEIFGAKGENYGKAKVYIDGIEAGEINQFDSNAKSSELIFASDPLSADSHTVKVVSEKTSALDAFSYLSIAKKDKFVTVNTDNEKFINIKGSFANVDYDGALFSDVTRLLDGASLTMDFFANSFKLYGVKKPGAGSVKIYVDGVLLDEISLDGEAEKLDVVYENDSLLNIGHTLSLVCSGETQLDAIAYRKADRVRVQDDDERIKFSDGFWTGVFGGDDGQTTFIASKGNAEMKFTGVSAVVYGPVNNNLGISEVYIDGELCGSYSQYSDTWMHQQLLFAVDGLTPEEHTIKIVNTDTKEAESQMTYCIIDYIEYDEYQIDSLLNIKNVCVKDKNTVEVEVDSTAGRRIDSYDLKLKKGTNKSYLYDVANAEIEKVSDTLYRFNLTEDIKIGDYLSVKGMRNFTGEMTAKYLPEDAVRLISLTLSGRNELILSYEQKEGASVNKEDITVEISAAFNKRSVVAAEDYSVSDNGENTVKITLNRPLENEDTIFVTGKNKLYGEVSASYTNSLFVKLNNDDKRINYTGEWNEVEDVPSFRDDISVTKNDGDGFELVFSGTSVCLYMSVGPNQGFMDVIIDGVTEEKGVALFNENAGSSRLVYKKEGLSEGVHVITVKKTQKPQASSAPEENFISLDAIGYESCKSVNSSYTLSGEWKIVKDETGNKGKTLGWFEADKYPFDEAAPILVPGNVYEAFPDYNGITWYGKKFDGYLKAGYGDRTYLEFEGVQYSCEVYLNGQYLGSHEGSAVPFEFDVTDSINLYGDNFLAVKVFNPEGMCKTGSASNYGAFWDAGGIWQEVNLHVRPEAYIENVYAVNDYNTGDVELRITVNNTTDEARVITLGAEYGERNGNMLGNAGGEEFTAAPGKNVFTLNYRIENFKLWDLDSPNLYYAEVTLLDGEKQFTALEDHLGFRHFEIKDGYYYLNGRRIYLKMTHQNTYDPVMVQGTPRDMYYINKASDRLKEANFNTLRIIGMEALPEQLDYCDEIGLLVYQESSQGWLGANNWIESVQDELILRDRNHPSLVIWGLLNEIYASDSRVSQCRNYIGRLRELDNDRVVFLDSGRFDHNYSLAGISNSGSDTWDVFFGLEGSAVPAVGDIHTYPQYPMNTAILDYILTAGEGGNPVIFSEAGTGAMFNPFVEMRGLASEGAANSGNYPYTAWAKNLCDGLTEVYEKYGLNSLYSSAEGIALDSIEVNKLQRMILINYIRANTLGNGYGVTSLSDSQGLGEGILDNFRNWKDGYDELLKNAWAPLRWDILLNNSNLNVEKGGEMLLRANITTEDILAPGEYTASFTITDADGNVVKNIGDKAFTVSSAENAPFAYYVLNETITADFEEGVYKLNCILNADYKCENGSMEFRVTDNSGRVKEGARVTVLGDITSSMRKTLVSNNITIEEYDADAHIDNEVIFVGKNVPDDAALWRGLYKKIAQGAYAAFLDPAAIGTDNNWLPSQNKGKREVVPLTMALYHADHLAIPNETLFKDLETGMLDPAYYGEQLLVPRNYFTEIDEPDEMNILMLYSQGLPISGNTITGTAMGTYNYFNGAYTINVLDLCNETTSPAVSRLLLNLVNYGLEKSEKFTPVENEEEFERILDSYNFKEDTVNMPTATIVDRENRKVKLVFDEYVRIMNECIYLSESPTPERYQSKAGASMEMVDEKVIDGVSYATTFILTFPEVNNLFTDSPYYETGIPTGAGCRFLEYGADPNGANGKTPNVVAPDGRQMKMNYVDGNNDIGFVRITVMPEGLSIRAAGNTERFAAGTVTQMFAEFTPEDTTNTDVIWSVEQPVTRAAAGEATIDAFGRLTAIKAGRITVKAVSKTDGNVFAKKDFEIYGNTVKTVTITGPESVKAGETAQYTAVVAPEDAGNKLVTWSVENITGEASVDKNGLLTAYKAGEVVLSATTKDPTSGVSARFVIRITGADVPAKSIEVAGIKEKLSVGQKGKIEVKLTPADSTDIVLIKSSDESVLKIDKDGSFTALKPGSVKVTVSAGNVSKVINVTVVKAGENLSTGDGETVITYIAILSVALLAAVSVAIAAKRKKRY